MSPTEAKGIAGSLAKVIVEAVNHSDSNIGDLDLICQSDLDIIHLWNSKALHLIDACVHNVVQQTSLNRPDALAVCSWDGDLTYASLEHKASCLASYLRSLGVKPGTIVPFCFRKSVWAVVSMLATLKAGGAPVALSLNYPVARSEAIARSTGATMVLVGSDPSSNIEDLPLTKLLVDETLLSSLSDCELRPTVEVTSREMAFIQFTSGSTGVPKGIIFDHGAFCTSAFGQQKFQNINESSRVLQFADYAFDASIQEIFTTLMAGGVVCIPSEERRMNHLKAVINEMDVNWAFFTPTLCKILQPCDVPSLKTLVIGGETASKEILQSWASAVTLFNGYGPSECTICCSVNHLNSATDSVTNIGKALPGANLWITRRENHNLLAPIGAIGELLVQGPNLSKGYLNGSEKVNSAFVESVGWLASEPGNNKFTRVYKTGDLVRYNVNGTVEFVGRKDNQVKIRGQRVELGEIEHHLQANLRRKGVEVAVEASQISHHGLPKQQTLIAYLGPPRHIRAMNGAPTNPVNEEIQVLVDGKPPVLTKTLSNAPWQHEGAPEIITMSEILRTESLELERSISKVLPSYLIPKLFVPLRYMPINLSGKLDRKLLRSVGANLSDVQISEYSLGLGSQRYAPSNPKEERLLTLWAQVLKIPPYDISIKDEFFLFGDSIAAIELVSVARDHGLVLTVADIFKYPVLENQVLVMQERTDEKYTPVLPYSLIEDKESVIQTAMSQCGVAGDDIEDILPCTAMQRESFSFDDNGGNTCKPRGPPVRLVFEILPHVDIGRFKLAWLAVVKQNSILRTRFITNSQGHLLQVVINKLPKWTTANDIDKCITEHCNSQSNCGDPSMQFALVQGSKVSAVEGTVTPTKNYFIFSIHQSIHDKVSLQLLYNQLHTLYTEAAGGLIAPYARYIECLSRVDEAASAVYWSSQLADPAYVQYPNTGYTTQLKNRTRSILMASVTFDSNNIDDIVRLAWILVLSNRTLSEDVLLGVWHPGRDPSIIGIESMTGPTEAVVPFRVRFSHSQSIGSAAKLIQEQWNLMSQHTHFGLKKIRDLGPPGEAACQFLTLLAVQTRFENPAELCLIEMVQNNIYQTCPLTLECTIAPRGTTSNFRMTFDEGIVSMSEARAVLGQMQSVTSQLLQKSIDTSLAQIDYLSSEDYSQIAVWNKAVPSPVYDCAHLLFGERVRKQPNAPAVDSWDGSLTYSELDEMASKLALYLLDTGLKPSHDVVPLCFEKSMWTIVAILGIIKAGGAFLPMDPSHPSQRLQTIVEEVNGRIILCSSRYSTKAASLAANPIVVDRTLFRRLQAQPDEQSLRRLPEVSPEDLLYIFYTSGSTGVPKGHRTPHQAYCSAATAQIAALGFNDSIRNFQFASYAYDVCISDILTGLCGGTCVCVPSEDERLNDVAGAMARLRVNFANLTPTVAQLLNPDRLPELRTLILGGEALQQVDLDTWASRVHLMVGYGPSECSPRSTINPKLTPTSNPRNIGFPTLCNCRGWVVDPSDHNKLRPVGLVGELVIEGPNVCAGYINSDETRSAFIEHPSWLSFFAPRLQPCGRFYKTGDLVRYSEDGSIIFVGRKDTQVKLHGQRIELGEVESNVRRALFEAHPVHVVAELVPPGGLIKSTSLVVFVQFQEVESNEGQSLVGTSEENSDTSDWKWPSSVQAYLSTRLSATFVPKYYVSVNCMPMLPSGKIDHKALRIMPSTLNAEQLGVSVDKKEEKAQPTSIKEYKLRQIWATVLNMTEKNIGIHDNFFHIGGDSISAIKMVAAARRINFRLTVTGIFNSPVLTDLSQVMTVEEKSVAPQETRRAVGLAERISREWDIDIDIIEDVYPATPLQRSLIALTTRNHKTNTLQKVYHLAASIDVDRFRSAWELIVSRHSVLRTRVVFTNNLIMQVVLHEKLIWEHATNLQEYLDRDNEIAFGYGTKLERFALVPDRDGAHYFVWTAHHVTYDGWSDFRTLMQFKEAYEGSVQLPCPPFKDFINYLESSKDANTERFWRSELEGFSGTTFPSLPSPEYWPLTDRAIEHTISLPQRPGAATNITLSTIIRCAWALTIGQYTSTQDVVFGAVQTGRTAPLPGIPEMIGPTITVVPVRVQWSESIPVVDLLNQIQAQSTSMIPYEHMGLKNIEALGGNCRAACAFQNLLIVQPDKDQDPPAIPGMRLVQVTDTEYPSYLLSMQCSIRRNELAIHASYDSSALSADAVQEIVDQFEHILRQVNSSDMYQKLCQMNLVHAKDLDRLGTWNSADLSSVHDTVPWAVERQMKLQPNAPAVCFDHQEISYGDLDKLSASLAVYLRDLGVGPEKIVAFCFDKSLWAVVAVLAILRAGGACAALDPSHPSSRHQKILQDAEAELVLASPVYGKLFEKMEVSVLCVDKSLMKKIELSVKSNLSGRTVKPSNAAFVVFTSGSTGTPKGIVLEHASICATSRGNSNALGVTASSRVLQFASFVFDVAIEDICITLMHGACICIASEHDRLDDLSRAMREMQVTWADLTTSVARTIDAKAVPSLKTLVLGGEMLGEDIISQWAEKVHVFNTYGPAECTIYSTTTSPLGIYARGNNIGRAIGCNCWVVDQNNHNRLLPVGCIGELLIEGPNLARGYLRDNEKTKKAFIHPTWLVNYRAGNGGRCYATGDLVKQNRDGTFDFIGRKDSQIKLRGQRIELGEIEHQVSIKIPARLTAAVEVISPPGYSAQQTLTIFYWPTKSTAQRQTSPAHVEEMTEEAQAEMLKLKNEMLQVLPAYMVPTAYVPLQRPPSTPTGKLDRRALRDLGAGLSNAQIKEYSLAHLSAEKRQPRNEREKVLQSLWASVLGLSPKVIGIEDSFFQLGGESIAAIRLAAAARRRNLHLAVAEIFRYPILSEMALRTKVEQQDQRVKAAVQLGSELTARVSREWNIDYEKIEDLYPCTWLQNDMILVTRRVPEANTLRYVASISPEVDIKRYRAAWEQVVSENSILRTRIIRMDGDLVLQVVVDEKVEWKSASTLDEYLWKDKSIPFDYGRPLVRFGLVKDNANDRHVFIWTAHHATYDGWSLRQVHDMVANLYTRPCQKLACPPFKDLVRYIDGLERSSDYVDFWSSQLEGFRGQGFPSLLSPSYKPLTNSVVEIAVPLPKPSKISVTMSTLIRAAYAIVIGMHSSTTDVSFGAIQTGRSIPLPGIADLVGPAISLVPVRIRWKPNTTIASFLHAIQEQSTSMIPYEHIAKSKIAALNADCASACAFQSLLIVQPMVQNGSGIEGVRKIASKYPEFLEYGLSLECKLGKEEMSVHADYDDRVLDAQDAARVIKQLELVLSWLVCADSDSSCQFSSMLS